jgi:hypothetical protein
MFTNLQEKAQLLKEIWLSAWDDRNIPNVFIISPQGETKVLVTISDATFLSDYPHRESEYALTGASQVHA